MQDARLMFSTAQAITADAKSTNVIDFGVANDPGRGMGCGLLVQVVESFNVLDTLAVQLEYSADDSSYTALPGVVSLALAVLLAGKSYFSWWPAGIARRYWRLDYNVGTGTPTLGKITAGICDVRQFNMQVPY